MSNANYSIRNRFCCIFIAIFLYSTGAHVSALPPDPDNAALLYYQAFLLLPDYNLALIDPVLRGAEPNEEVREYIEDAREAIDFAEAAAEIPDCTWGIMYSQGLGANITQLAQFRYLTFILSVDALIHATDEDYRTALEKCLTIRRLAEHIGDDTLVFYLASINTDVLAQLCIQDILEAMPPDADTLGWLQGRLVSSQGAPDSPARALQIDFELYLQSMRTNPDYLIQTREHLAENAENQNTKDEILSLTNEELIALIVEPYPYYLDLILGVIDCEMPYEDKYIEIQRLISELNEVLGEIPGISQPISIYIPNILRIYSIQVAYKSQLNAIKAAIEIYLEVAQTGQLPESLPANLPKDPFSSQDFEYEITEEGFILRCQAEDLSLKSAVVRPGDSSSEGVIHEYEFKVQS